LARILVIDDDQIVRTGIKLLLVRSGYEVVEAVDGVEGVASYQDQGADLVLVDMFMPNKSGFEVLQELKRFDPDVKMVSITGMGIQDGLDMEEYARRYGALETLQKPIDTDLLLETVAGILQGKEKK
jgi:DNA-binding NtrC family response regulator